MVTKCFVLLYHIMVPGAKDILDKGILDKGILDNYSATVLVFPFLQKLIGNGIMKNESAGGGCDTNSNV